MQKLVWKNADGTELNLTSGSYGITNWEGFSNTELNLQTQKVPFQDGSVYLDSLLSERELSVTLAINDGNDLYKRYQLRRELIKALNPKNGEGYLVYTNDYISKRIKCVAQIPIFENKNSNDSGTPKASLSWTACDPYWEDVEETKVIFKLGILPIVSNKGDFPVPVKVDFFTNFAKNPTLWNLTTKKKISYAGILNSSLYIDTNIGEKKVITEKLEFYRSNDALPIRSIIYSEQLNMFVAVGDEVILNSYSGKDWEKQYNEYALNSITYSEQLNMFASVGNDGAILTSSDGITWIRQTSGINRKLTSITYSEQLNMFVAVGNGGAILTSSDGITWIRQTSGTNVYLYSITYSEQLNMFVAVGANSSVINSKFLPVENQIQKITIDSDMNFNLLKGYNQLRLNYSGGSVNVRVTYRQKYIGV